MPCLRRVSQLGQQGGHGNGQDEYAEMIMNFAEEEGVIDRDGDEQDEWVATHTNSNGTVCFPLYSVKLSIDNSFDGRSEFDHSNSNSD